jgi:hypothetical protein
VCVPWQVALEQVPVLRPTAQLLDALEAGYGAPGQDDSSARLIMEQASVQPDRCILDVAASVRFSMLVPTSSTSDCCQFTIRQHVGLKTQT